MTTAHRFPDTAPGIDPWVWCHPGQYIDDVVAVLREDPAAGAGALVVTDHFRLLRRGRAVELCHRIRPAELDNDLAGLIESELFASGWLSGRDTFERVFTGVVRSCVDGAMAAWTTFYANTLTKIQRCWLLPPNADPQPATIAGFAPVYRKALRLIPPGQVLDLGSCFGFLPMLVANRPLNTVIASDISENAMGLLAAMNKPRASRLRTLVCDAASVPLPDQSVDTVTVIHLLEHLEPVQGNLVVREALRLARRRVVIAVPFEDRITAAFGHVRRFTPADLVGLGHRFGRRFVVEEQHGGWLVLNVG